jgi:hypothetical protein
MDKETRTAHIARRLRSPGVRHNAVVVRRHPPPPITTTPPITTPRHSVPEPSASVLLLIGLGMTGLGRYYVARRKRSA